MTQASCDMLELASLGAAVLPKGRWKSPKLRRASDRDPVGAEPGNATSQPSRRIGSEGLSWASPWTERNCWKAKPWWPWPCPDEPGVAARLFEGLGAAGLNVDLIMQATHDGSSNIAFTLAEAELPAAEAFCRDLGEGGQLEVQSGLAKLSASAEPDHGATWSCRPAV